MHVEDHKEPSLTDLHMWGIDYRTASTDLREKVYLDPDRARIFEEAFAREPCGVASVVLCTCNRTELYLEVRGGRGATSALVRCLTAAGIQGLLFLGRHGHHASGMEAAEHLYRVCAGLESMILGENEILAQVKRAYRLAQEDQPRMGLLLSRVFQGAFRAGKRVRAETELGAGPVGVAAAAVDEAHRKLGDLSGLHALLVGAGKIGSTAAGHFLRKGIGALTITNRSLDRALEAVRRIQAGPGQRLDARPFSELASALAEADVVLTATGSRDPIITKSMLAALQEKRKGRRLHLFDIAVPRDVHPDVREVAGVHLTDIDQISGILDSGMKGRLSEVPAAESIIREELLELRKWSGALQIKPAVVEFRSYLESLAEKEMAYVRRRQPPATASVIEESLQTFIGKLLQRPARRLRTACSDAERSRDVQSLTRLFELRAHSARARGAKR